MTDTEIVHRILHGETARFRDIVRKYNGAVYAKALSIVKSKDAAADVAQQTFIKAYTSLDCWTGKELGPWLMTIACHMAINELSRADNRPKEDVEATDVADEPYTEEHEQQLQKMERLVERLPEDDRTILRLHYYKNVQTKDIATQMGISLGSVLMRLHRIRERLKKQMTEEDE